MTPRVELTIDELVLDGFEDPSDAIEPIRDELRRRLGREMSGRLGTPVEPVAVEIARAAERGAPR
jgi:hypothetical protein